MALTDKKKAFIAAVLAGKSKKDAAIAAGYSAKTASAAGTRLGKDPDIIAFLQIANSAPPTVAAPEHKRVTFDVGSVLMYSDPKAFLLAAMNDPAKADKLRVDAAKSLMPFAHTKKGDGGKKNERADAAKAAANKFLATPPPLRAVK